MFNAIHEETGLKVDFRMLKGGEYDRSAFARRVRVSLLGTEMFLPAAEDVIITKLDWHRLSGIDKHYFDAGGVAAVQKGRLDTAYIERWCATKSLTDLWLRIQRKPARSPLRLPQTSLGIGCLPSSWCTRLMG